MYTQTNGVISTIQLAPGSYRLALNPAGYPISYRSKASALHIDVVAGTTTEILVPLIPADAITGTVKNSVGEPIIVGVSKQFRSLMAIDLLRLLMIVAYTTKKDYNEMTIELW